MIPVVVSHGENFSQNISEAKLESSSPAFLVRVMAWQALRRHVTDLARTLPWANVFILAIAPHDLYNPFEAKPEPLHLCSLHLLPSYVW